MKILNYFLCHFQRSTLTIVREPETPKYCVGLPNYTARQSVGVLNFQSKIRNRQTSICFLSTGVALTISSHFIQISQTVMNHDRRLLNTASQLQLDQAYVVISPGMQNNDRKTVFDTLSFLFETFIRDLFRFVYKLKTMYSSKIFFTTYLPHIQ